MIYKEYLPPAHLSSSIECFWSLIDSASGADQPVQRIVPDGRIELVFHLGMPYEREHRPGLFETQPQAFLVGQTTSVTMLRTSQHAKIFGVRFQSAGALPFFGVPLMELTGKFVDLETLFGAKGRELDERVRVSGSAAAAKDIVQAFLSQRCRTDEQQGKLIALTRHIGEKGGIIPVRQLAFQSGKSERQLERDFQKHVGIGPKTFSRILRFKRVFEAMSAERNWAAVAVDCGYYDQPHLLRDFREFAGLTPSSLDLSHFEMGLHFLLSGRVSGFSKKNA